MDFLILVVLAAACVGLFVTLKKRRPHSPAYKFAVALALAAAFLLFWVSLGVGIIGDGSNDANMVYVAMLGLGFLGALAVRFKPRGTARVMVALAAGQVIMAVVAVAAKLGHPESGPAQLIGLNGFFVVLWIGSARLFQKADQESPQSV